MLVIIIGNYDADVLLKYMYGEREHKAPKKEKRNVLYLLDYLLSAE